MKNIIIKKTPPLYDLGKLKANVALFTATNDYLADPDDVQKLIRELPKDRIVFEKNIPAYSHIDFIWGIDAKDLVYKDILDLFSKY